MPANARTAEGCAEGSAAGAAAAADAAEAACLEVLSLRVGDACCALPLGCVQEIRAFERPTRIAHAAACVLGVVNLRGAIVPIVDARRCLDGPAGGAAPAVVIVLTNGRRTIGLAADAAGEVLSLGPARLRPPAGPDAPAGPVRALACIDGRVLQLLDADALLGLLDGAAPHPQPGAPRRSDPQSSVCR